jgi:hypothetical protein
MYALLITLAVAAVTGRILSVPGTHADNDRSRWDTVRALVEHGTYAIGHRDVDAVTGEPHDRGFVTEENWETIDKVLRPDTRDFYSSKPPLLPTLVAGEYWVLHNVLGWSAAETPWLVVRTILLTINGLPFLVYLLLLACLVERLGTTDWGRLYVLAVGCFGTFLNPFENTFSNHTVATCSALFALYPTVRIWYGGERKAWLFVLAGFCAGSTACTELPAAAFAALLFVILFWHMPRQTAAYFLPALAIPVVGFLLTNYLAIGQLRPAYGEFGGPWYQYEGSHWIPPTTTESAQGIDWAFMKESKAAYAFHVLLGHHGWFSLTPVFLLSLVGIAGCLLGKPRRAVKQTLGSESVPVTDGSPFVHETKSPAPDFRMLAGLTLALSVVVMGFYILKTGNYGGWTVGLRWLMWLTPLWLLMMLPVADRLSSFRSGRALAYVLLAVSVFSATYSVNPWRHPWLYTFMEYQGWVRY